MQNYNCPVHYQIVRGFCLSYECKNTEFCINCLRDGQHVDCKQNCKQFDEINEIIEQSLRLVTELDIDVKKVYDSINEQFAKIEKILVGQKQQLIKLQESLATKIYGQAKSNIVILKDWHDYFKNADFDSLKTNNSTRNELFKVQGFIHAIKQSQDLFDAKKFSSLRITAQFDVEGKITEGLELSMKKQWKEACQAFEAVQQFNPVHCENLFYLSIAKNEINELQNSYLVIQQLESLNPRFYTEKLEKLKQFKEFALSRVIIGITLTKQNFPYAAKEQFMKAIQLDSYLTCAHNYYCELFLQGQNFYEAEEQINKVVIDQYAKGLYNKGVILFENQQYRDAVVVFEKVLTFDKKFAYAHYYKGLSLQNQKKPHAVAAKQSYIEAQNLCHPNDVQLSSLIKKQLQNLQRYY